MFNQDDTEIKQTIAEAISSDLYIEYDGQERLEQLTSQAALMHRNMNGDESDEAIKNAKILGTEIIQVSLEQGTGSVTQSVIDEVLRRICPLYPFC